MAYRGEPARAYACGFLFDDAGNRLLLIRKKSPLWQAGKLNGIGGKLEEGETPLQAMIREADEEAGVLPTWYHFCDLQGDFGSVAFFAARSCKELEQAYARTEEPLEIRYWRELLSSQTDELASTNLTWLIPLALDHFRMSYHCIEVREPHVSDVY